MHRFIKGFTFIESILTIALVLLIGTMAVPFYGRFVYSEELPIAQDELAENLKRAQLFTLLGKNNARFGVAIHSGAIVFFQGDTYASRDTRFDEVYTLHPRVSVSGADEVVFNRPQGTLSGPATFILSDGNVSVTMSVNREGVVEE